MVSFLFLGIIFISVISPIILNIEADFMNLKEEILNVFFGLFENFIPLLLCKRVKIILALIHYLTLLPCFQNSS